jgi:hypothetical protein
MGTRTVPFAGNPGRNWVSGLPSAPRGRRQHRRRPLPAIAADGTVSGEQRFDGKFPTALTPQPTSGGRLGSFNCRNTLTWTAGALMLGT